MYSGKTILVLGLARSGIAVAELLLRHGAKLILCDESTNPKLQQSTAHLAKADIHLGEDPSLFLPKADILVISPGVPIDSKIVQLANQKNIPVLGELEVAYTLSQTPVMAVTGTNGKTTSVTLLGEIMKNAGKIAHVVGNVGFPYSAVADISSKDDIMVCEVSSFQLESTHTFHPAVAALLNITEDHLNRHKTMEEYIRLKFKIFENQTKFDVAVLNFDDELIKKHKPHLNAHIMWFSRQEEVKEGAFVRDGGVYVRFSGKEHYICSTQRILIPGPHNLENAMAMACMAIALGVKPQVIAHTLHNFKGVQHRIQTVAEKNGICYINDSKGTNPDSTQKAVASMQKPTNIILGGYNKHADFHALATQIKDTKFIKNVILIGETAHQLDTVLNSVGFTATVHASSMEDAVSKATALATEGYNVLLSPACASFDMYTDFEQRGEHFCSIVQALK